MIILGIETSCDETAAAVVKGIGTESRVQLLSNIVASSAKLQAKYGGVIPEQAAREQIKSIIPVIETAIDDSRLTINEIDAMAVTFGPGLIGSLLVGVETAKTLARVWGKPLIAVNHLIGHFYANWITPAHPTVHLRGVKAHLGGVTFAPQFPCIGLLVSGGHTDLVLFKDHGKYDYLGGTRDDAAGECFDKCARLLNLPYPGGPHIAKLAQRGNPKAFDLPRPMIDSDELDFSFSGLKTAFANLLNTSEVKNCDYTSEVKCNLAASLEKAIVDVLVAKTIKAAKLHKIKQIMVAGGVAANSCLSDKLRRNFHKKVLIPLPELCTDNAAMIASCAFYNYKPIPALSLQANPSLSLRLTK